MMGRFIVFIVIAFVINIPGTLQAQKIQRTVLAPSVSVMTPAGGLQWTAGQVATERYAVGPQRLTTGFQQSYRGRRTLALLRAMNFEGMPGDTVSGVLILEGLSLVGPRPSDLRVTISFNKTLLAPIRINDGQSPITKDIIDGNMRRITFEAPVDPTAVDANFATIDYIAGLGNDSLTVVGIDNVESVGLPAIISTRDGVFSLLGICFEGGPRLIEPDASPITSIMASPNPARDYVDVAFEMSSDNELSIDLYNHIGQRVLMVLDNSIVARGQHRIRIDLGEISSGTYILAVSVNGEPLSTLLTVGR